MGPRRRRLQLLLACCLAFCGSNASADPSSAADSGPEQASVGVWYRSTDGCPDGGAFLARLRELGRSAHLASVGDRVDFVITLEARSVASSGRLERQTERGTVAIRELSSARCEEVAEGLALSLELALDPDAAGAGLLAPDAAKVPSDGAAPAPRDSTPVAQAISSDQGAVPGEAPALLRVPPWRAGAQGTLTTGIAPALAPGAALFLERGGDARDAAGRLSLQGSYGASRAHGVRLAVGLIAARLEGCAFGWDAGTWSLTPCIGADAGLLVADSPDAAGRSDRGFWASALGLVRARIPVARHWMPEAQLAFAVPLTRYAIGGPESSTLFRTGAIAGQLSLGMCWLP
jgi:hypothetical protein